MNPFKMLSVYNKTNKLIGMFQKAAKSAEGVPLSKSLFASKTFWFNALTVAAELTQLVAGMNVVPPGVMTTVAGVINIGLRAVTEQPVHVIPPKTDE